MTQKPHFFHFEPDFGQNCTFRTFSSKPTAVEKWPFSPYSQAIMYGNYVPVDGSVFLFFDSILAVIGIGFAALNRNFLTQNPCNF